MCINTTRFLSLSQPTEPRQPSFQGAFDPGYCYVTPSYIVGHADTIIETWARRRVADSAGYLQGSLEPHMKILDVGCGPGSITIDFARHVPIGHVIGVDQDAAEKTLERARAQAAKEGVTNVEFAVADGLALPFPDDTFDVVHANHVIQYVSEPVQFLREMRRVAKPGGLVAVRTWDLGLFSFHPNAELINNSVETLIRTLQETGREPYTGRNLHIWARQAGFDPAETKTSSSNDIYRTTEQREVWSRLSQSFSLDSPITKVALSKGFVTEAIIQQTRRNYDEWVANEDGSFIQVNWELLARA